MEQPHEAVLRAVALEIDLGDQSRAMVLAHPVFLFLWW